jgi:hypothetical protein
MLQINRVQCAIESEMRLMSHQRECVVARPIVSDRTVMVVDRVLAQMGGPPLS